MKPRRLAKFLLGCLLTVSAPRAEDIDLFMGTPGPAANANLLLILDNTANGSESAGWPAYGDCTAGSPKFCYERAVLKEVIETLNGQNIHVGLMMFAGSGPGDAGGAYVRYAIRTANAGLAALVGALDVENDRGGTAEYALALHEAYLYFRGMDARSGIKPKADAAAFATPSKYRSPEGACPRNIIVFIGNGLPDPNENAAAESLLAGLGGKLSGDPIDLGPGGGQANWSDEYARFLASGGIRVYTVDAAPSAGAAGAATTALLKSMAQRGKGRYYPANDPGELKTVLTGIFNEIRAVTGIFAAAAVPASVNVRGSYLNQVYLGMFRPDAGSRWFGNLKLFRLLGDSATGELFLADSTGRRALNGTTSLLADGSLSFWTSDSEFWRFRCAVPRPDPPECGMPPSDSDSPDGPVAEKGGAGQKLRAAFTAPDNGGRKLYTCLENATCGRGTALGSSAATRFDTANDGIAPADLGAADETEREKIIDWVRGADNASPVEKAAGGVRPSILGDVLHSRPVAVNYNRYAEHCKDSSGNDNDLVVFHGGNDGILHALRGGGNEVPDAGEELWGFIPKMFFGRFKRLRDNAPPVNFPSVPLSAGNKPYFIDGNLTVLADDADRDCRPDAVYLFATLRRGGRSIYALDVTDPDEPKFLWRKDPDSPGYEELGQTWSELKPVHLAIGSRIVPAVIFGAGYDPAAEDRAYDPVAKSYAAPAAASAAMGRGVFVAAAETGEIIRHFGPADGITHAIPSDVAVLANRGTGIAYRAYVGDTGGNVWRLDLGDKDPGRWALRKLAQLGGSGVNARKFLFAPDVVRIDGGFAVLLGSGDREHPFDTAVKNRFYMLKDLGEGYLIVCDGDETGCELAEVAGDGAVPKDKAGWYLKLEAGEKVVGGSTTLSGATFFPTHRPSPPDPSACTLNLGTARLYAVNHTNGAGELPSGQRYEEIEGGGFLPTPLPVAVALEKDREAPEPETDSVPALVQGVIAGTVARRRDTRDLFRRRMVYWFKEGLD
jgi:type IV pilus assembly protein PilY1